MSLERRQFPQGGFRPEPVPAPDFKQEKTISDPVFKLDQGQATPDYDRYQQARRQEAVAIQMRNAAVSSSLTEQNMQTAEHVRSRTGPYAPRQPEGFVNFVLRLATLGLWDKRDPRDKE